MQITAMHASSIDIVQSILTFFQELFYLKIIIKATPSKYIIKVINQVANY